MRKTRSDSKLLNLPEEQQAQLADWLLGGLPYHAARQRLSAAPPDGFGVSVSLSALSEFWQAVCAPALIARRKRAVSTAHEIAEEAARSPGRFDQATVDAIKQRAFELAIAPHSDPEDVRALFSLILKAREQDISQANLELAQEKFRRETCALFLQWAEDQKAREIASSPATHDTKLDQLYQLMFGEARR